MNQMMIGDYAIRDVLIQAWKIKYPTVDFQREYPLMVLWLEKNPSKTPKNPIRFIENWLKKTHATALRNLTETGKRAQVTAERVGAQYKVTPNPGESQEAFNRRVIAAASLSIVKRVA